MALLGFQNLPQRVRVKIYEELFVKAKPIDIPDVVRKSKPASTAMKLPSGLSLLRANKQIYREALQVLYGRNKFILDAPGLNPERITTLKKFLKTIGTRGRRELKFLALRLNLFRLRARMMNKARLTTVARLGECFAYLEKSWFKVFELFLDDKLFIEVESFLEALKIDELVIRASPPFVPPPELLKTLWASRIVVIGSMGISNKHTPRNKDTLDDSRVYRSIFADETFNVDLEYTPSAADRKDHLSALPIELRELIYEELLAGKKEICPLPSYLHSFCGRFLHVQSRATTPKVALGLLHTSRLLHGESSQILYGQNVFKLESHEKNSITNWLLAIGERNRKHLRFLRLNHDVLLRHCELDVPQPWDAPSLHISRSVTGAMLGKKISKTLDLQIDAINEYVAELSDLVAADYTATLKLLKDMPHLSRLELHIPYQYSLSEPDDIYGGDGPMSRLEPVCANGAMTMQTINMLPEIRLSTALRLGIDVLSPALAEALEFMGVAKVVLFNPEVRDWIWEDDEDLLDIVIHEELGPTLSAWSSNMGPGILARVFRPHKRTKLERRISRIWPKTGELYCACCGACERRHLLDD